MGLGIHEEAKESFPREIRGNALFDLRRRIDTGDVTIGVIGLGYVGLPLCCTIAEAGLRVAGFDVDAVKLEKLDRGESYIRTISDERVKNVVSREDIRKLASSDTRRAFVPTGDLSRLADCDAILVCVPTPLNGEREPDLSFVVLTAEKIAEHLRPGQLVVLESTTYPGTTDEIVLPILEKKGLQAGTDFALAFSPEREDPGNPSFETKTIPKLVGGVTPLCGSLATALYRAFIAKVEPVTNARVAESAKLLENIFRSVNIALVNELKMLFDRMGIDVWEVVRAASTKPFGYMPFFPGPGLGGHCIPIDPFYLTWKAHQYDFSTRFIELAGEINRSMPYYVVNRVAGALAECGKPLEGSRILVLGVAYKKDVNDLRESPALKLIELLEARGASLSYNDPYVPSLKSRTLRGYGTIDLESVPISPEELRRADCVLIATDHTDYDVEMIVRNSNLIVDTRNATAPYRKQGDRIVKA
ncbi:MAG: nucleotide sugar dehydrogenase [Candidatus Binatia bacterium]